MLDGSGFRSPVALGVCGDGLLIDEREQLGGISLTANHGLPTPFCEGLREVGMDLPALFVTCLYP